MVEMEVSICQSQKERFFKARREQMSLLKEVEFFRKELARKKALLGIEDGIDQLSHQKKVVNFF